MSKRSAPSAKHSTWKQSFADRANLPNTPALSSYLFRLMMAKRSNLCLSADVQSTAELLDVAEECGNSICVLKTHADIVDDFGERTIKGLIEIAGRKKFLVFEDRKFGDIGNTVQSQYAAGPYRIASWANIVNAHIFPGPAIITSLKSAASSAVAAYYTTTSTEISGGGGEKSPSSSRSPRRQDSEEEDDEEEEEEEEDDDDEDNDDDDESEDSQDDDADKRQGVISPTPAIDIPERPMDSYQRKPSVISINTTISSSTEVLNSPTDSNAPSSALPDRPPIARGLLLLAKMSSEGNMFTPAYMDKCLEFARQHRDFVVGFIAQGAMNREPGDNFLVLTPGINMPSATTAVSSQRASGSSSSPSNTRSQLNPRSSSSTAGSSTSKSGGTKGDGQGQQYNSPRYVILEQGVDVIIVGRGILNVEDRAAEAERYRLEGWNALRERTEH